MKSMSFGRGWGWLIKDYDGLWSKDYDGQGLWRLRIGVEPVSELHQIVDLDRFLVSKSVLLNFYWQFEKNLAKVKMAGFEPK